MFIIKAKLQFVYIKRLSLILRNYSLIHGVDLANLVVVYPLTISRNQTEL